MVSVYFTREFIRGHLAGIVAPDRIRHLSKATAERWVRDINRLAADGKLDYKVISHEVTEEPSEPPFGADPLDPNAYLYPDR